MNIEQKERYDEIIKDLNEFEETDKWSLILENNENNYEDALVNLCMILATIVYYVEFSEENGVKAIRYYLECLERADDIFKEINWDGKEKEYQIVLSVQDSN